MPRSCTICRHPEREVIDKALVDRESYRNIAKRFETSVSALVRHKADHLLDAIIKARDEADREHSIDLNRQIALHFKRINKLFDACDVWLADPDDPTRYDIGPRAEEFMVTYYARPDSDAADAGQPAEADGDVEGADGAPTLAAPSSPSARRVRRKAPMGELLARIEAEIGEVVRWETKYADPRELVLKTAAELRRQAELLAEILGKINRAAVVNVLAAPEWAATRAALVEALADYPEARVAVAERLGRLGADARDAIH